MVQFVFAKTRALAALTVLLMLPVAAWAQLPHTQLFALFPPGGQAGATIDIAVTAGNRLEGLSALSFSHPGITAVALPVDPMAIVKPMDRRFTVTIKPDVPPGYYEVRAVGTHGLSNARVFAVGDLPEHNEQGENQSHDQAYEMTIDSVINAVMGEKSHDYFNFAAKAGQRILIECQAARIDSRLDPVLVLFDSQGQELQRQRRGRRYDPLIDLAPPTDGEYRIQVYDSMYAGGAEHFYRLRVHTQPHIDFIFPPSGLPGSTATYTIYGRNLPGSTTAADVAIDGRPLEQLSVKITVPQLNHTTAPFDPSQRPLQTTYDAMTYRLDTPQGPSNRVTLAYATAPVVIETEPNDAAEHANKVDVPCEIAGRFNGDRPDDMDWFTFDARGGEVYHVEMYSHQSEVPTDPSLLIQQVTVDEQGAEQVKDLHQVDDPARPTEPVDDTKVPLFDWGMTSQGRDPSIRFTVPDDGTYRLLVRNLQTSDRGDLVYRLVVRPAQPDFRLVAAAYPQNAEAQSLMLRPGGVALIKVFALRRDGLTAPIHLRIDSLPPGVHCEGTTILPGTGTSVLVLRADDAAAAWSGAVRIIGEATVGDTVVTREARTVQVPGRDARWARTTGMMPLTVATGWRVPVSVELGLPLIKFRQGPTNIPVKLHRRHGFSGKVNVTIDRLPYVRTTNVEFEGDKTEGVIEIHLHPRVVPDGFNFAVLAVVKMPYPIAPSAAAAAQMAHRLNQLAADAAMMVQRAEKAQQHTQAELDKANSEQEQAKKTQQQADEALKPAQQAFDAAKTKLEQAQAAAAKEPDNEALAQAITAAQGEVSQAGAAADAAQKAKAAADKAFKEAEAKQKAAAATHKVATDAMSHAKQLVEAGERARPAIDNLTKMPPAVQGELELTMHAGVLRVVDRAPIVLHTYQPEAPLQQGGQVDVPVKIRRLLGYADAVVFALASPNGVKGISLVGDEVKLDTGQTRGTLTIAAAGDATAGTHELTVKARVRLHDQDLELHQPLSIEVAAAPQENDAP